MPNQEIECRFLEIDKNRLINKLAELGAEDLGEVMLEEIIIYDKDMEWPKSDRFVRLRKIGNKTKLSYKEQTKNAVDGTCEVEFDVSDYQKAELFLQKIGLLSFRRQQKKRHTFTLDGVTIDIDTWPKIPTYVELEADNEDKLRKLAIKIGFEWKDAVFNNAAWVIEEKYKIPVRKLRWFTFDRIE